MTNHSVQGASNSGRTIYLTTNAAFIKITDHCGQRQNNGVITLPSESPAWLSLKKKKKSGASPSYLIDEIAGQRGNFTGHPSYKPSPNGNAISLAGSGYEGGVQFLSVDDAIDYLAQYFNVVWCDGAAAPTGAAEGKPKRKQNTGSALSPCNWPKTLSDASDLFRNHASGASPAPASFNDFYDKLRSAFQHTGRLDVILGTDAHMGEKWLNHPGVYVVRASENTPVGGFYSSILYVGMTGKLSRRSISMPGRLSLRPQRLDPYRFSDTGFSYGHNRTTKNYGAHIPAAQFEVDCFVFDATAAAAPAFLEALILQAYALCATDHSLRLPPANNAF
jgi:hypothetical protein